MHHLELVNLVKRQVEEFIAKGGMIKIVRHPTVAEIKATYDPKPENYASVHYEISSYESK